MQRIQDPSAVPFIPDIPPLAGPAGYFTGGNPTGGVPATVLRAWWLNMIQEELMTVVTAGGQTPNSNGDQLLAAMRTMFGGTGTLGGVGYMRLPGGVILQWGTRISNPSGITDVTFPIGFPTTARSVVVSEQNAEGWGNPPQPTVYGSQGADRFGFIAYAARIQLSGVPAYGAGLGFNWMAIGD
jgi:hypothetical protein